jgi:DNA-binding NtrC family response regulator
MSKIGSVLVLDDDVDVLRSAAMALSRDAECVDLISRPDEFEAMVRKSNYNVLLLDMNFAPGDHLGRAGLDILGQALTLDPTLSVVLMTGFGRVSLAVDALKRGATDFVLKPWRNEKLVEVISAASLLSYFRRQHHENHSLDAAEKQMIERALDRCGGNISQASTVLGLTRWALARRMAKHGL